MKILIIRFSSIGDIVLTSPVARCLKRQLGAEVHFLTKSAFAGICQNNPFIDKVFALDGGNFSEIIQSLRRERYDLIVDLHHNLRSQRVKLALRRPARSFDKLNFEKWLLVNLKIDRMPDRHIVDRYMDTVRHLGVQYDGEGLDYFIPEKARDSATQFLNSAFLGPFTNPGFTAFVIGATHFTKRLPTERLIDVCRLTEGRVVVLGGKTETEAGRQIAEAVGEKVIDACGKLSLDESAAVVGMARKVLTHDTGLMHIAAALGAEIVSVWGSTTPKLGMYPFFSEKNGKNFSVENLGLSCRPCSKIGYKSCPKGHFKCMNDLSAPAIAQRLNG